MTSFRRAAVCLALVAMMLRGLMPMGWMPNPQGAGTSLFVICDMDQMDMSQMGMSHSMADMDMPGMSGMDMAKMDMSATGHGLAHKHSTDSHQQACPFGAAPHVATSTTIAAVLLPSLSAAFSAPRADEQAAIKAATYKPQSPRAPPIPV